MVVVTFFVIAWFSIHVLLSLPKKLPLIVNVLLFMAIEVILTNKLTFLGFNLHVFRINTASIPHFIALILHNDFTVTTVLLMLANVYLTAQNPLVRWGIVGYAFFFQLLIGAVLRWMNVLTDTSWNYFIESAMIIGVMIYTLLIGWLLQRMASKEGWVR